MAPICRTATFTTGLGSARRRSCASGASCGRSPSKATARRSTPWRTPMSGDRTRLRIAAPERLPYDGPKSLAGQRIATSYPRLVRRFLSEQRIDAEVVEMKGAVELAPRLEIATHICDLVSTGATLEANGLRALDTILESQAVLLRTRKPLHATRG